MHTAYRHIHYTHASPDDSVISSQLLKSLVGFIFSVQYLKYISPTGGRRRNVLSCARSDTHMNKCIPGPMVSYSQVHSTDLPPEINLKVTYSLGAYLHKIHNDNFFYVNLNLLFPSVSTSHFIPGAIRTGVKLQVLSTYA